MGKRQNKYRYERKYLIKRKELNEFYKDLFSAGFYRLFPDREVNNIYFDDFLFNSLNENINGNSSRKKYRVRWYGTPNLESRKYFEIKVKSENTNFKENFELGALKIDQPYESSLKLVHQRMINILPFEKGVKNLKPTLINNYKRSYFFNEYHGVRLTIDFEVKSTSLLSNRSNEFEDIIIEIKYNKENNFQMLDEFRIHLSKNSKYVNGIMSVGFSEF